MQKQSKALTITGWVLRVLGILFLLMDGIVKFLPIPEVVDIGRKLGFADGAMIPIGIVIVIGTLLYAVPQTAILGAVLLTGHLGGAVATHVRVSVPENNIGFGGEPFNIMFPVIIGLFVWGGIYFRDKRLRSLIPLRK
jgi:hypothetical protein